MQQPTHPESEPSNLNTPFFQVEVPSFDNPSIVQDQTSATVRTIEGLTVASEVAFVGGLVRYGGFALILATTKNTVASTAYLAASTAVIESGSAVAMSNILERDDQYGKTMGTIDKMTKKILPEGRRVSLLAAVVITNYLGIAPLLYAKNRENKERTLQENRRTGLIAASLLTGACAVQGALVAEGVTDIDNPKVVLPVIGAFAAIGAFGKWAKRKINRTSEIGTTL